MAPAGDDSPLEPGALEDTRPPLASRGSIRLSGSRASLAQAETGKEQVRPASIKGSVRSASDDSAIGGAHVVLVREKDGEKRLETDTAADGSFSLTGVEPGEWTLTVSAQDMLAESRKLTLLAGELQELEVMLEEVEAEEVLRITGKRTLIHPEQIGSRTNLDEPFVREYKSGDDLRDLLTSTPGIMPDSLGNIIVRGEHDAVNYELDGVILPEAAGVLQQTQFVSPRSLQSMQVDIGGYQAQDGGGPLGAVARMKSLPIQAKPTLQLGGQLGGPLAGSLIFYASGALSQRPNSILNRIRFEASGATVGTSLGIDPPLKQFVRNGRVDMNYLGKVEFKATERDTFKLTGLINETFLQIPTSGTSRAFGVRMNEHDRQNLVIFSYHRRGDRWFDEANLHFINAFYSQRLKSRNAFDPFPILNGEEASANAVAPLAKRFNYVFGAQGDISKTVFNTHKLTAGFLTEVRPVRTHFSALYYNANLLATAQGQQDAQAEKAAILQQASQEAAEAGQEAFDEAIAGGATPEEATAARIAAFNEVFQEGQAEADAINPNPLPYAAPISPFTGQTGGPLFVGDIGRYRGFRYLQSAFFQDSWRPARGFLRRLTADAGVRVDVYHGVFGNTMKVAETLLTIPDLPAFSLEPFQKQKVTDAQASGRFGAAFVLTKSTVVRGSFSQIFQPPPVDVFVQPTVVEEGAFAGIFPGTIRPLRAIRGNLVDTSIEQQIGPRFVTRTNFFYKNLENFGDSGVIANTLVFNRLSLARLKAVGVETRIDLKPAPGGYGLNGFVSNTVQYAKLAGCRCVNGGVYEFEEGPPPKVPDHDRRYTLAAGLGYKTRRNLWMLGYINIYTGLPDRRDFTFAGTHGSRAPVRTLLGFNAGYQLPKKLRNGNKLLPSSVDIRIDNLLNQRLPVNLGSPFQGTRFTLPLRVLAGMYWDV